MNRQRGFTLIELAIVLVILTILAGGLLMPLTKRIEVQRYDDTRKLLEQSTEALIGYAMSHADASGRHYLPCPDTDNDGIENRSGSACPTPATGNLPWATLGLASVDAWGNRITYTVSNSFADSASGFQSVPPTPSEGDNRICATVGCPAGSLLAEKVPVVLMSHGKNGLGARSAYNVDASPPVSSDEIENDNGGPDFVSRPPGGEGTLEFDDLVMWIPSSVLFARICPAGGCP